tara:strand:- start:133 stop:324 length:192 start_codon:yes stop_codon:yes gene_type:complete
MAIKSKIKVGDLVRLKKPYFINEIGIVIEVTEGKLSDFVYRIKTSYSLVVTSTVQDIEVINKA